jgi:hypothetical protein
MKHIILLFIILSSSFCYSQNSKKNTSQNDMKTISGIVSDAVNGMKLKGVQVSTGDISKFTNSDGFFTLEVPVSKKKNRKEDQLTFSKSNFDTLVLAGSQLQGSPMKVKMKSPFPLLNILHLFTDPSIPDQGPHESITTKKCAYSDTIPDLIGGQLARHNFIYIGENHRRICVVIDGKLAWHYDTEDSWEDDEIWVLSNGNILHAHMTYIEEITPKKEVVWRYDNPKGSEIHTCQPIGVDKVLFLQNQGDASVVKLYNKVTGKYEIKRELKELNGNKHGQCRRFRLTKRGTYIAATMNNHLFYEYDKDFNVIWKMDPGSMWGGIQLKNGNFLVQNEGARKSVELNRAGEVVWQVSIDDIQPQLDALAPGLGKIKATQACERLSNGNTVVFTRFCDSNIPQAIEITPDKKVVWILKDWKHLGDGLTAQFFSEPGYPEIPGDTNH